MNDTAPPGIDRNAVVAGALAGTAVLVPLFVIQVALTVPDDDPARGWAAALLAGFALAFGLGGYRSASRAPHAPLVHGALGGLVVLAAWVPLRLVVAGVANGESPLAGIVSGAAIAALVGMIGGFLVLRRGTRR